MKCYYTKCLAFQPSQWIHRDVIAMIFLQIYKKKLFEDVYGQEGIFLKQDTKSNVMFVRVFMLQSILKNLSGLNLCVVEGSLKCNMCKGTVNINYDLDKKFQVLGKN